MTGLMLPMCSSTTNLIRPMMKIFHRLQTKRFALTKKFNRDETERFALVKNNHIERFDLIEGDKIKLLTVDSQM